MATFCTGSANSLAIYVQGILEWILMRLNHTYRQFILLWRMTDTCKSSAVKIWEHFLVDLFLALDILQTTSKYEFSSHFCPWLRDPQTVGDKVGDYRLPACPHLEPPSAETPVGCSKSSDNWCNLSNLLGVWLVSTLHQLSCILHQTTVPAVVSVTDTLRPRICRYRRRPVVPWFVRSRPRLFGAHCDCESFDLKGPWIHHCSHHGRAI
jgi:hypothetical protein